MRRSLQTLKVIALFLLQFTSLEGLASLPGGLSSSSQPSLPVYHLVKKSENLASILRRYSQDALWGKDGLVQQTIRLNSWLEAHSGNYLPVGVYLRLPQVNQTTEFFTTVSLNKKLQEENLLEEIKRLADEDSLTDQFRVALLDASGGVQSYAGLRGKSDRRYFNEKKIVREKMADGRVVEKTISQPWRLNDKIFFKGRAGGEFTTLSTNSQVGNKASLSSNPGLLGQLDLGFYLSEEFKIFSSLRGSYMSLEAPEGVTLSGGTQASPALGLGATYSLTPRWDIGSSIFYEREVFVLSNQPNSLQLAQAFRLRVETSFLYKLWRKNNQRLAGGISPIVYFARSAAAVDFEPSLGAQLAIHYRFQLDEKNSIGSSLHIENHQQKTSLNEADYTQIGLGVQYFWE